ncbi:hypothetical protein [Kitasatospora sp. HPMI-4]|uniref:hypothetical protein n=1 Tax=Kitasatospora sp. HPMI-4 TaxID=3448443 RepID=UPI003F19C3AA
MHDPVNPADPGAGPLPSDEASGSSYERVVDRVRRVIAWYGEQIFAERQRPAPDVERLQRLLAERKACNADLQRLDEANAQELARLGDLYDAKLSELAGP